MARCAVHGLSNLVSDGAGLEARRPTGVTFDAPVGPGRCYLPQPGVFYNVVGKKLTGKQCDSLACVGSGLGSHPFPIGLVVFKVVILGSVSSAMRLANEWLGEGVPACASLGESMSRCRDKPAPSCARCTVMRIAMGNGVK